MFSDLNQRIYVTIANGVLVHEAIAAPGPVDATLTITRPDFLAVVFGAQPLPPRIASGAASLTGDASALQKLASWMDPPTNAFPIVTRAVETK